MTTFQELLPVGPEVVDVVHRDRISSHVAETAIDAGTMSIDGDRVVSFSNAEVSALLGYEKFRESHGSALVLLTLRGLRGEVFTVVGSGEELRHLGRWLSSIDDKRVSR